MRKLLLALISLTFALPCSAGNFTSAGAGPADWNTPASWNVSNDADGIPDTDDTITVQAGHQINVSTSGATCRYLTVDGTINITSTGSLYIYRDYTVNGTESGSGSISFVGNPAAIITGSGTFSSTVRYSFSVSRTIDAGTVINKSTATNTSIGANITLTNNGTLSLGLVNASTSSVIFNGATGTLRILKYGFSDSNAQLNASTVGNTVIYSFSDASYNIKTPVGNTYHHLTIAGSTTKNLTGDLIINGTFTINSAAGLNMNNFDLSLGGTFANNSNLFTQSSGTTITFIGNAAQSITCSNGVTTNLRHIIIDNNSGVSVTSGIIRISEVIQVLDGNFNVGSGNITLLSNATSTGRIAATGATGSFSGSMTIQRYIDGRSAGYSDMASPVQSTTIADWDNELLLVYGYGSDMSPSAWAYSESGWDYVAITSSGANLVPGRGYEVYLDSDGSQTTFNATTITTIGTPNYGDIDMSSYATRANDGWNLMGNPYAAHIDWSAFQGASGGTIAGTYMYYDETISDFASASSGTIAPTQGFWIEVLSAPANATFTESMKSTSSSSAFRSASEERFTLRLQSDLIRFTSNAQFEFDPAYLADYEMGVDLPFMKVPHKDAPQLYTVSTEGKKLRINKTYNQNAVSIPMGYKVGISGKYAITSINREILENSGYSCAYLIDTKTGIKHDLFRGDYSFYADTDDSQDRFILEISKDGSCSRAFASLEEKPEFTVRENIVRATFTETEGNSSITIFNSLGQVIAEERMFDASLGIAETLLPEAATGLMIVQLKVGDKNYSYKIIR